MYDDLFGGWGGNLYPAVPIKIAGKKVFIILKLIASAWQKHHEKAIFLAATPGAPAGIHLAGRLDEGWTSIDGAQYGRGTVWEGTTLTYSKYLRNSGNGTSCLFLKPRINFVSKE